MSTTDNVRGINMEQEIFVDMDNLAWLNRSAPCGTRKPTCWWRLRTWLRAMWLESLLFALLITLGAMAFFAIGPFSYQLPEPPVSMASQCQATGKWCLGAICGGCERGKPATFEGMGL